jgi:hypothetical protein
VSKTQGRANCMGQVFCFDPLAIPTDGANIRKRSKGSTAVVVDFILPDRILDGEFMQRANVRQNQPGMGKNETIEVLL